MHGQKCRRKTHLQSLLRHHTKIKPGFHTAAFSTRTNEVAGLILLSCIKILPVFAVRSNNQMFLTREEVIWQSKQFHSLCDPDSTTTQHAFQRIYWFYKSKVYLWTSWVQSQEEDTPSVLDNSSISFKATKKEDSIIKLWHHREISS